MHQLNAQPRQEKGKKVKQLREKGMIPAVLYGQEMESRPIAVPSMDFERAYREAGESSLVILELEEKPYNVLIHDIARDPIKDTPIHADFYAVRMDKTIRVSVPLAFVNESPAVKNEGGVLIKAVQELEVEALPANLPHELMIDLSLLTALESHLAVKDIAIPPNVKILADPGEVIAVVEAPRSEEELKALEQVPVFEATVEVKTEQEIKRAVKAEAVGTEKEEEPPKNPSVKKEEKQKK